MGIIKLSCVVSWLALALCCRFVCCESIACPCSTPDLCKIITKQYSKELVAFSGAVDNGWKKWNWTELTHVVYFGSLRSSQHRELYCHAHKENVRITYLVGVPVNSFPKLSSPDFRKQIIDGWLKDVRDYYLDGINIDIEGFASTPDIVKGINDLTNETYVAMKSLDKSYLITWDLASTPYAYGYDVITLSKFSDYFIIMDYDARYYLSIADANSPYDRIERFYDIYLKNLSISPNQLVMAVPWYGYDFTCSVFVNSTDANICFYAGNPLKSYSYAEIQKLFHRNIGGLKWDSTAASPYFSYKDGGTYHQMWFDNVESLTMKYKLALSLKLRGLGMWQADFLDYQSDEPMR